MVKIQLPSINVIYRDVFNMKFLYTVIHEWLVEEGWTDLLGGDDHQFLERLFLERRVGVKEIRIWWRSQKSPDIGKSSFYKYRLNIYMNVINMTDTEVVHEGKKLKAQKGEITIFILPMLDFDYDKGLEKHWLVKYFFRYFRTRVLKKQLEARRKELIRDTYRLQGMIKKYLEERLFIPEFEVFHEKFEET